jgi:hypothetical protein
MAIDESVKRAERPIKVSEAEAWEGTLGVCLWCGEIADGVEPDAERYECDCCGRCQVFGIEMAAIMGCITIVKDREGSSHG